MSDTNESQVVIALRSFLEEYKWDESLKPKAEVLSYVNSNQTYKDSFDNMNALEVFTNGKF